MSGKETVQFTVKGPLPVHRQFDNSPDSQKKMGCSVIELHFQNPCQLGELVFTNHYTAFLSIYLKRFSSAGGNKGQDLSAEYKTSLLERSATIDMVERPEEHSKMSAMKGCSGSTKTLLNGMRKHHNSGGAVAVAAALNERPWECSIHMKPLMPCLHFELGSQDVCSIQATESLVEWRDVMVMRIVLQQPSTVWKRFYLEDINVFRNLPKRGYSQCDEFLRQKDGWLSILKNNTKTMLSSGQLVEPETEGSNAWD